MKDTTRGYAVAGPERLASLKTITTVVYALQAASFILPITLIVAVVIDYVKRDEATGTWLDSHFRWQIRTFWFGLLWGFLGTLTAGAIIGYFILLANLVWMIYRVVKGWLYLHDEKVLYPEHGA